MLKFKKSFQGYIDHKNTLITKLFTVLGKSLEKHYFLFSFFIPSSDQFTTKSSHNAIKMLSGYVVAMRLFIVIISMRSLDQYLFQFQT